MDLVNNSNQNQIFKLHSLRHNGTFFIDFDKKSLPALLMFHKNVHFKAARNYILARHVIRRMCWKVVRFSSVFLFFSTRFMSKYEWPLLLIVFFCILFVLICRTMSMFNGSFHLVKQKCDV